MFPDNLTRAEARARSALIATQAYRVLVDLTGTDVPDPSTQFRSVSTVTFSARRAGELHIDLIADAVLGVSLDGEDLDPGLFASSRLPFAVAAGEHELTVTALCRFSRSGEGLHRFVDPADDRVYLYTQFETADARRMFACFEQPDLKARFALSVLADRDWLVESCGAEVTVTEVAGSAAERSWNRWEFSETAPISTYLTALIAGDYARVRAPEPLPATANRGPVPMSILCRQSMREVLDAERVFATTIKGFAVFERHFGHPYAFGKYDQAFVPEYNGGAMENVGCVTLRDEYLFRSRVTAAAYEGRDDTILHELAHMWFGDLVTMRWWDDLWLKESFATWASHFATSETAADPTRTWARFCSEMKAWAYRQDQLPSTHPIAADMVDLEATELNFDGITYAKGASVLRQLVAYVGREAFLAGLVDYFATHAYGNTTLADLLAVLERSSGRDLSSWSAQWLETAGVNTLVADYTIGDDGAYAAFAVRQTAPAPWPTLRQHRIAIGLYARPADRPAEALARVYRLELDVDGPLTPVPELIGRPAADLVVVNDDDLSYVKIELDPRSLDAVLTGMASLPTPLVRAVCWGAAWNMCRDAKLPAHNFVLLVAGAVGAESELAQVAALLAQGYKAAVDYTPLVLRQQAYAKWHEGLSALLDVAAPGSDHQLAFAKAWPASVNPTDGADRLAAWLEGELPTGLTLDPELRWNVVHHLARLGRISPEAIEAEQRADDTITGAEAAAAARAALPDADTKADAWRLAVDTADIPNGTQRAICRSFWARGQDELLRPYIGRYFAVAEDISAMRNGWDSRSIALRNNVLRDLFPQPYDLAEFLGRLDAWLDGAALADSVRRVISERRDDTVRSLRCQLAGAEWYASLTADS